MGSRRKSRILAFQALFAWETNHFDSHELLNMSWVEENTQDKLNDANLFANILILGTIENIEEIDSLIKIQLEKWDFSRISKIDLALLRMSVYSLKYQNDISASIIIDEAVDIAKKYSNNDSYKFINGVLDGINKKVRLKP